jgi:hypothetical protein
MGTPALPAPNPQKSDTFKKKGNEMAVKVKPVQPTEIKDKKIDDWPPNKAGLSAFSN